MGHYLGEMGEPYKPTKEDNLRRWEKEGKERRRILLAMEKHFQRLYKESLGSMPSDERD